MTLSAYCLTGRDASSSLLVCNPVNDCKIGPSRCACVVKTEHARWPQNSRRDVELRWAHTRLRRKAGTESACRLGYHCSSFMPVPSFECWKRICSACPWLPETGGTNCFGLGSFFAFLWQPEALPPSPGTPVSLSKMRKLLLANPLSSRRCQVEPSLLRHVTWLLSTH